MISYISAELTPYIILLSGEINKINELEKIDQSCSAIVEKV